MILASNAVSQAGKLSSKDPYLRGALAKEIAFQSATSYSHTSASHTDGDRRPRRSTPGDLRPTTTPTAHTPIGGQRRSVPWWQLHAFFRRNVVVAQLGLYCQARTMLHRDSDALAKAAERFTPPSDSDTDDSRTDYARRTGAEQFLQLDALVASEIPLSFAFAAVSRHMLVYKQLDGPTRAGPRTDDGVHNGATDTDGTYDHDAKQVLEADRLKRQLLFQSDDEELARNTLELVFASERLPDLSRRLRLPLSQILFLRRNFAELGDFHGEKLSMYHFALLLVRVLGEDVVGLPARATVHDFVSRLRGSKDSSRGAPDIDSDTSDTGSDSDSESEASSRATDNPAGTAASRWRVTWRLTGRERRLLARLQQIDRVFQVFAIGSVSRTYMSFDEFVGCIHSLLFSTRESRIQTLFTICDLSGDNFVSMDEVKEFVEESCNATRNDSILAANVDPMCTESPRSLAGDRSESDEETAAQRTQRQDMLENFAEEIRRIVDVDGDGIVSRYVFMNAGAWSGLVLRGACRRLHKAADCVHIQCLPRMLCCMMWTHDRTEFAAVMRREQSLFNAFASSIMPVLAMPDDASARPHLTAVESESASSHGKSAMRTALSKADTDAAAARGKHVNFAHESTTSVARPPDEAGRRKAARRGSVGRQSSVRSSDAASTVGHSVMGGAESHGGSLHQSGGASASILNQSIALSRMTLGTLFNIWTQFSVPIMAVPVLEERDSLRNVLRPKAPVHPRPESSDSARRPVRRSRKLSMEDFGSHVSEKVASLTQRVRRGSSLMSESQITDHRSVEERSLRVMDLKSFRRMMREVFRTSTSLRTLVDRIFAKVDSDDSGVLNIIELLEGLSRAVIGSLDDRANWFFDLYDLDQDGSIQVGELAATLFGPRYREALDKLGVRNPGDSSVAGSTDNMQPNQSFRVATRPGHQDASHGRALRRPPSSGRMLRGRSVGSKRSNSRESMRASSTPRRRDSRSAVRTASMLKRAQQSSGGSNRSVMTAVTHSQDSAGPVSGVASPHRRVLVGTDLRSNSPDDWTDVARSSPTAGSSQRDQLTDVELSQFEITVGGRTLRLHEILRVFDINGDGEVSRSEFVTTCNKQPLLLQYLGMVFGAQPATLSIGGQRFRGAEGDDGSAAGHEDGQSETSKTQTGGFHWHGMAEDVAAIPAIPGESDGKTRQLHRERRQRRSSIVSMFSQASMPSAVSAVHDSSAADQSFALHDTQGRRNSLELLMLKPLDPLAKNVLEIRNAQLKASERVSAQLRGQLDQRREVLRRVDAIIHHRKQGGESTATLPTQKPSLGMANQDIGEPRTGQGVTRQPFQPMPTGLDAGPSLISEMSTQSDVHVVTGMDDPFGHTLNPDSLDPQMRRRLQTVRLAREKLNRFTQGGGLKGPDSEFEYQCLKSIGKAHSRWNRNLLTAPRQHSSATERWLRQRTHAQATGTASYADNLLASQEELRRQAAIRAEIESKRRSQQQQLVGESMNGLKNLLESFSATSKMYVLKRMQLELEAQRRARRRSSAGGCTHDQRRHSGSSSARLPRADTAPASSESLRVEAKQSVRDSALKRETAVTEVLRSARNAAVEQQSQPSRHAGGDAKRSRRRLQSISNCSVGSNAAALDTVQPDTTFITQGAEGASSPEPSDREVSNPSKATVPPLNFSNLPCGDDDKKSPAVTRIRHQSAVKVPSYPLPGIRVGSKSARTTAEKGFAPDNPYNFVNITTFIARFPWFRTREGRAALGQLLRGMERSTNDEVPQAASVGHPKGTVSSPTVPSLTGRHSPVQPTLPPKQPSSLNQTDQAQSSRNTAARLEVAIAACNQLVESRKQYSQQRPLGVSPRKWLGRQVQQSAGTEPHTQPKRKLRF